MNEIKQSGPDRFFLALSVCADAAGVLSFVGINPSSSIRWVIIAVLALFGAATSGITLVASTIEWYSPKGSQARPGFYRNRILLSLSALAISIILGAFLISAAAHAAKPKQTHGHTTSPPSSSPRISSNAK